MSEPKMAKHLGMWIPISKWVQAMDGKGMDLLLLIKARLQDQGTSAEIALDRGVCCVYREVVEHDINGKGVGYREWARSIQLHSVRRIEDAKYDRKQKPRPQR